MPIEWNPQSLYRMPHLMGNEVHIWNTKISENVDNLDLYWSLLTPNEQSRSTRYYFNKDKNRYIISRAILKMLVAGYIQRRLEQNALCPLEILFEYNRYGKPFLGPEMNVFSSNLKFNLAHSRDSIIYIFANNIEVGIDIEFCDSKLNINEMVYFCCSEQEKIFLQNLPISESKRIYFYAIWVVKEAITKSIGMGLSYDIKKISVNLSKVITTNFNNPISVKVDNYDDWNISLFEPSLGYYSAFALSKKIDLISYFSLVSNHY